MDTELKPNASVEGNPSQKSLLIIVPAFNEECSIASVIDALEKLPFQYVIIDDGSTDATAKLCESKGAKLVQLPFNQGLTGAFQAGMRYALENGYEYAMQFDADGQHMAEYIVPMVTQMLEGGEPSVADIIIGSRFLSKNNGLSMRSIGMRILRALILMTTGVRLTDPTSGMRLYNRRMIAVYANELNFGPEPDTLAYLLRCGAEIREAAVKMRERQAGKSYLNAWASIKYMAKMAISILVIQFVRPRIAIKEEC